MNVYQNILDGKYKNPLPYGPDREGRAAYQKKEGELLSQFYKDLREEFDLSEDNVKHERLLSIAWDHGHSSGLHEVYGWVNELVDLL